MLQKNVRLKVCLYTFLFQLFRIKDHLKFETSLCSQKFCLILYLWASSVRYELTQIHTEKDFFRDVIHEEGIVKINERDSKLLTSFWLGSRNKPN